MAICGAHDPTPERTNHWGAADINSGAALSSDVDEIGPSGLFLH
jgi:hypothetical protein